MTAEMFPEMNEDERVTHALERSPEVAVPAGFAARVMEQLPERRVARARAQRWVRARRTYYGRNAMLMGAAALLIALLVLAVGRPNAGAMGWRIAEWTALAQLSGIALWYGLAWKARISA